MPVARKRPNNVLIAIVLDLPWFGKRDRQAKEVQGQPRNQAKTYPSSQKRNNYVATEPTGNSSIKGGDSCCHSHMFWWTN